MEWAEAFLCHRGASHGFLHNTSMLTAALTEIYPRAPKSKSRTAQEEVAPSWSDHEDWRLRASLQEDHLKLQGETLAKLESQEAERVCCGFGKGLHPPRVLISAFGRRDVTALCHLEHRPSGIALDPRQKAKSEGDVETLTQRSWLTHVLHVPKTSC